MLSEQNQVKDESVIAFTNYNTMFVSMLIVPFIFCSLQSRFSKLGVYYENATEFDFQRFQLTLIVYILHMLFLLSHNYICIIPEYFQKEG